MSKKTATNNLSQIHSLDELHHQQKRLKHQIDVQEQCIHIDTNNIQAAWNNIIDFVHNTKEAVGAIAPTLSYFTGGLRIVQFLLRRHKSKK